MKQMITIAIFLIFVSILKSQHPVCGFELGINGLNIIYPGYKNNVERTFDLHKNSHKLRDGEILKIKVVFHVVYNDSIENIKDENIYTQLDELNKCYRRLNADTINTRPEFKDVVGDSGIEFELEEIIRVHTNVLFEPSLFALPDNVKESNNGGSDAKDPNHFLNIWICKMQPIDVFGSKSPLLGYAYPPNGLANWPAGSSAPSLNLEGVVLDYRTVGEDEFEIEGMGSIPMLGRTCVHEVGHYLGLRHISGDGSAFGGVSCDGNDGIDDTPTQGKQSEFNCNHNQNTCNANVNGDLPDMIENYMDYSREDCQNSFTNGQINVMRNVIMGVRSGLLEGTASTNANDDVAISVYPNPSTGFFKISSSQKITKCQILNSTGSLVMETYKTEIDLYNQLNGLYFLKCYTANDKPLIYKLIKG